MRPRYQRLGIGKRLVGAVLDLADERRSRTLLTATEAGLRLYLTLGFRKVGEIRLNLGSEAESAVLVNEFLLRESGSDAWSG